MIAFLEQEETFRSQFGHLAKIGMRGRLQSDQKGENIGLPIQKKDFLEGLRITDFI